MPGRPTEVRAPGRGTPPGIPRGLRPPVPRGAGCSRVGHQVEIVDDQDIGRAAVASEGRDGWRQERQERGLGGRGEGPGLAGRRPECLQSLDERSGEGRRVGHGRGGRHDASGARVDRRPLARDGALAGARRSAEEDDGLTSIRRQGLEQPLPHDQPGLPLGEGVEGERIHGHLERCAVAHSPLPNSADPAGGPTDRAWTCTSPVASPSPRGELKVPPGPARTSANR